ncbi:cytochrome b [Curvivirga sp.]|uniref:cytochrome b n=1 Tax=Curvivirga sp. TaxID=2856848 RepID=UPI003B5B20FB
MSKLQTVYSPMMRFFHWIMAVGFIFMWACGYAMTTLVPDDGALEEILFMLHISVGVTLLGLFLARVINRFRSKIPAPLEAFSKFEVKIAHLGHFALYALIFVALIGGWAEVDLGGHGVKWFGIEMPKIFPTMEFYAGINVEELSETVHKYAAYGLLGLTIFHIGAVIKHRRDGHDVLPRMLPNHGKTTDVTK